VNQCEHAETHPFARVSGRGEIGSGRNGDVATLGANLWSSVTCQQYVRNALAQKETH
jgi:hypothetical protein